MSEKNYKSKCCNAETKTDGIPDFIGSKEGCTVNFSCTKCGKPCNIKEDFSYGEKYFGLQLGLSEKWRKKLANFLLCWIGWFVFFSATASFVLAVYRYLSGGFLGQGKEVFLCLVFALFYTIWWFLVIKRSEKSN